MKTAELTGAALDYAVALIEYPEWKEQGFLECLADLVFDDGTTYAPSTDWAQGGTIIERENISMIMAGWDEADSALPVWEATSYSSREIADGHTPLIAAMRCYVASKFGDDVEIPEELK